MPVRKRKVDANTKNALTYMQDAACNRGTQTVDVNFFAYAIMRACSEYIDQYIPSDKVETAADQIGTLLPEGAGDRVRVDDITYSRDISEYISKVETEDLSGVLSILLDIVTNNDEVRKILEDNDIYSYDLERASKFETARRSAKKRRPRNVSNDGMLDLSRVMPVQQKKSKGSLEGFCTDMTDLAKKGVIGEGPEGLKKMGLSPTEKGSIKVDKDTMATAVKGVFACGDVTGGARSVIHGIASGRQAAESIDRHLGGEGDITLRLASPEGEITHFMPDLTVTRMDMDILSPQEGNKDFDDENQPTVEEAVMNEARRCLRCDLPIIADTDICCGCITCQLICSFKANSFNPLHAAIKIEKFRGGAEYGIAFTSECDGCGLCVRYCPRETLTRGRKEEG